jgi:hypothetical protein
MRLPLMMVSRRRGCVVVVGATLPIAMQGMKAMADRAVPRRSPVMDIVVPPPCFGRHQTYPVQRFGAILRGRT